MKKDQFGFTHFGILILVILVLSVIGFAGWRVLSNHTRVSKDEQHSNNNHVAGDYRSIFAYVDGDLGIENAEFSISSTSPKEHAAFPFLETKGVIAREAGILVDKISIDTKLVEQHINKLKQQNDFENREYQPDLKVYGIYHLDMAGLMSKLGYLPTSSSYGPQLHNTSQSDTDSCKAARYKYDSFINQEVKAIQPSYKSIDSNRSTWVLDLGPITDRIKQPTKAYMSACMGERKADETIIKDRLVFTTTKKGNNIEFNASLIDTMYSDKDHEYEIFKAVITPSEKSIDKIDVSKSVFTVDNTSAFMLAVDRCKGLPYIAGGGLFGVYDYSGPEDDNYDIPNFFDTAYYCTAKAAELAGYERNR